MIDKMELKALFNQLKSQAEANLPLPGLKEVSIKNFSGEWKILFLEIARHIIELVDQGGDMDDFLLENKNVLVEIKKALEELLVNKNVFNVLFKIQKQEVSPDLAKLYIAKLAYE